MTSTYHALDWIAAWGAAPDGPVEPGALARFANQTVRLIVRASLGGSQLRIRLSNEHGTLPLRIGAAHLALRQAGADIVPGSARALTFSGFAAVTVPAGAPMLSDPVALLVPDQAELAVSLYFPGEVDASTVHANAAQTNYVSLPGNFSAAAVFPIQQRMLAWPFLTELDVLSCGRAMVAFGDAITDGNAGMRDANHRWPDFLGMRLQAAREQVVQRTDRLVSVGGQVGIVNRGAGGLAPGAPGNCALARFERDVLATAGVRYVIVQLGLDDLGMAETLAELVSVYRQMIARARARNVRIYGATLLPFEGARHAAAGAGKELLRQAANDWVRQGGEFDAVIDFDQALRDPAHHARLLPMFNSGDAWLPNDLGMQAMANAIPLELFRTHGFALGGDAV